MANEIIIQTFAMNSMLMFAFEKKTTWIYEVWGDNSGIGLAIHADYQARVKERGYASASVIMDFIKGLNNDTRKQLYLYILDNY